MTSDPADCARCGAAIDDEGHCHAAPCPFSLHAQDCPAGCVDHPGRAEGD